MVTETELFYLLLLVVLTLFVHLVLSKTGTRQGGKTHR